MPKGRNPIYDEISSIWFGGKVVSSNKNRIGKAAFQLTELGATVETLRKAVAKYRKMWPTMTCTPEAIVKHWQEMSAGPPKVSEPKPPPPPSIWTEEELAIIRAKDKT